mmetsp:Transcript_30969/g.67661  ORF Transcript_30969/g.67661 Transcript_30969/m.67661 type:complete len:254 (+) Transcript_30969:424-1185(+)
MPPRKERSAKRKFISTYSEVKLSSRANCNSPSSRPNSALLIIPSLSASCARNLASARSCSCSRARNSANESRPSPSVSAHTNWQSAYCLRASGARPRLWFCRRTRRSSRVRYPSPSRSNLVNALCDRTSCRSMSDSTAAMRRASARSCVAIPLRFAFCAGSGGLLAHPPTDPVGLTPQRLLEAPLSTHAPYCSTVDLNGERSGGTPTPFGVKEGDEVASSSTSRSSDLCRSITGRERLEGDESERQTAEGDKG